MITEFSVERFRSLKSIKLSNLKRINIIVGKSGSGKTAILEAVRVGLGASPSILWTAAAWRGGLQFGPQGQTSEQFEALWRPYFFDFDVSEQMVFKFENSAQEIAIVKAFFDENTGPTLMPLLANGTPAVLTLLKPFVFDRLNFQGEHSQVRATMSQGQISFDSAGELGIPTDIICASVQTNGPQVANWFSILSVNDNEHEIVQIIRDAFPEVSNISVQSPQGVPLLFASLRSKNRKLPISSVSSGLNKLVAILVAVRTFSGGVVLIDEIENGIYFEMFPMLWRALEKLCQISNTQLVLTTHSAECLKAAFSIEHIDEFSVYQVHQDDGETKVHYLSGKDAASAIEIDIEVRR